MEESEDRRLRLKAMRREADEAEASPNMNTSPASAHLSNPLAEFTDLPMQQPVSATRFDFYTDPMAAFSGNRRKCQKTNENSPNYVSSPLTSVSPGPLNLSTTPSPSQQYNQSQGHSSDQGMYGTPLPHHTTPPNHQYNQSQSYSSGQGMYGSPLPHHTAGSWRSPNRMASPSPQQPGTPTFNGTPGYGFPPNSPVVGAYSPNSDFRVGVRPSPSSVRGRGYQFNNNSSPSPNVGRGGGSTQFYNSPNTGSGRGGSPSFNTGRGGGHQFSGNNRGRGSGHQGGRSSHRDASARDRPDLYFHRSMLEDPWRYLQPVVRKLADYSSDSWLPKSIREKNKASETATPPRSGRNFAAALAACYEEAALAGSYEDATSANDVNDV